MCGLVGAAGSLEFKDESLMKRLLILDFFRGQDATGLAAVRHATNEIQVIKAAVNPIDLFQHKRFDTVLTGMTSKVFIGHNRAATVGNARSNLNAHPFESGQVVGAHNGTLDNPSWRRLEAAIEQQTNVDSEAIIIGIDKLGIEATVALMEEGRASNTGAWALTWFDGRDNTINFLRNKHRPLWRAWSKDLKKLYWASEWPMIRAAVDLGTTQELYEDGDHHFYFEFAADVHYKADLDVIRAGNFTPKDFVRKTVKGREPVTHSYGGSNNQAGSPPFLGATHQHTPTTSGQDSKTGASSAFAKVVDLFGTPQKPLGGYIDIADFYEWTGGQCCFCEAPITYDSPGLAIYEDLQQALCSECSHDAHTTRIYANPRNMYNYLNSAKNLSVA